MLSGSRNARILPNGASWVGVNVAPTARSRPSTSGKSFASVAVSERWSRPTRRSSNVVSPGSSCTRSTMVVPPGSVPYAKVVVSDRSSMRQFHSSTSWYHCLLRSRSATVMLTCEIPVIDIGCRSSRSDLEFPAAWYGARPALPTNTFAYADDRGWGRGRVDGADNRAGTTDGSDDPRDRHRWHGSQGV